MNLAMQDDAGAWHELPAGDPVRYRASVAVPVVEWIEVPATDEDGEPILGADGEPLTRWTEAPVLDGEGAPVTRPETVERIASYNTVLSWNEAEREAKGIRRILPAADVPEGAIPVGERLVDENGSPRRAWLFGAPVPPRVPQEVTRRQAKIALSRAGLLAKADAAIAAMEGQAGEEARIDWADADVFRRDHPLIVSLGTAFGLSAAQIDALFLEAVQIQ